QTSEDFAVDIGGHLGAGSLRDQVEQHVFSQIDQARVVVLEATVPLVVLALGGWHGLGIGHEWTIPGALPAESKSTIQADERLPRERVFELLPCARERGA